MLQFIIIMRKEACSVHAQQNARRLVGGEEIIVCHLSSGGRRQIATLNEFESLSGKNYENYFASRPRISGCFCWLVVAADPMKMMLNGCGKSSVSVALRIT